MTRRPFDSGELGGGDPDLERVTRELEAYTRLTANESPRDLADGVMSSIGQLPAPRRGLVAGLLAPLAAWPHSNVGRAVLVAGTVVVAIAAVAIAGELANLFQTQVGPSPAPSTVESITVSPSPTPEESTTPLPSVTPSPSPTLAPATPSPQPTESDTPETRTTEPSESPDDDDSESPHPSEDNSGPGGGGGGDDDDSA